MTNKGLTVILSLFLMLSFSGCDSQNKVTTNFPSESTHIHNFVDASCEFPRICECGETDGNSLGHDFSNATCTSPSKCSRCGTTSGNKLEHDFSDATCTSPSKCSRCGATSGNKLEHDFSDATCTQPKVCTRCSTPQGDALGHNYYEHYCLRCGKRDPDSYPVSLGDIHIIDKKSHCGWTDGCLSDSFGNQHIGGFYYNYVGQGRYSVHNLGGKYSTFSGSIIVMHDSWYTSKMILHIYLDDILVYTSPEFGKTTGQIDFSIDVSGGTVMTIKVDITTGSLDSHCALVNTELTKK